MAVSLANYGMEAAFVTRLPDNDLTTAALRTLRGYGVDVSHVCLGGERMGTYFVEKGASQRPSKVIYDRKYSAIATAASGDFDWDAIFSGADWFHFTGITPALSDGAAELCLEACCAAKARGVKFGRPYKELPTGFQEVKARWERGELSARAAGKELHIPHSTFLHWAHGNIC